MKDKSKSYILKLIDKHLELKGCLDAILLATECLIDTYKNGGKVLVCGNGGSAADSEHIVGELMKGFILPRTISANLAKEIDDEELSKALQYGLPTISLVSQSALISAFSNDQLPSAAYAQQVLGYGRRGDTLICISTSGNSLNCVYAAKVAKAIGVHVISLTGKKASKLSTLSDCAIQAPAVETFLIQEYHLPIYHAMCLAIENEFYGD